MKLLQIKKGIYSYEYYYKRKFNKGYKRNPCSLFRILRKLDFYKKVEKKVKPYIPKPHNTQKVIDEKWQLDVKYVPKRCYLGLHPDKFYQYAIIDKASGERFIYPFKEQSSYDTKLIHTFDVLCNHQNI